jgi:hypothetical protein
VRKFLIPALAIALVMGLVIADTEASSGNTFTAWRQRLDLKISDDDEGYGDGVSATWVMYNMIPGVTTATGTIGLRNSGRLAGDHVEIAFSHTIDEITNPVESDTNPVSTPGEMARWLEITSMTYNGVDFKATYTDANSNGFFDLEDVTLPPYTNVGGPLDNLPAPVGAGIRAFTMALAFHANATNDIQGDILNTTVTFTLKPYACQQPNKEHSVGRGLPQGVPACPGA